MDVEESTSVAALVLAAGSYVFSFFRSAKNRGAEEERERGIQRRLEILETQMETTQKDIKNIDVMNAKLEALDRLVNTKIDQANSMLQSIQQKLEGMQTPSHRQ